jgi:hypothetical protein
LGVRGITPYPQPSIEGPCAALRREVPCRGPLAPVRLPRHGPSAGLRCVSMITHVQGVAFGRLPL